MGYFTYKEGNASRELGYGGRYNSAFHNDVSISLEGARYKSPTANTYAGYKFAKYDPDRKFYGMPWGNFPVETPYKSKGDNFLANYKNIPTPSGSHSSGSWNTISTAQTVSHYYKYVNGMTYEYYNGGSSALHSFGGGSLIILACAQGGGGAGGQYNHYSATSMNVGLISVSNQCYAYCGGGGGGGGAFGMFYVDMSVLGELYITETYVANRGAEGKQGSKGGSYVFYKGSSTSGTKLYTVHGGGGGRLVDGGVDDWSIVGVASISPELPYGGAGGTVETHTTVDGIQLVQSVAGGAGGTGGGAGGSSNDNSIVQDPTDGSYVDAVTLVAPMLATPPTLTKKNGGGVNVEYIDSWWEGWGGGGGASIYGGGGNGGYLPSDRDDAADDGRAGSGYGGGGGGGGLIQDWWGNYNRSKGGNGAPGVIYFYWSTSNKA